MGRPRKDDMGPGRRMIEKMMIEAEKGDSKVSFEDKLKLIDRWMKFQLISKQMKAGGLGSGFEDSPTEEGDEDEPGGN